MAHRSPTLVRRLAESTGRLLPPLTMLRIRGRSMSLAGFNIGFGSYFMAWPTIVGSRDVSECLTIGDYSGFNVGCYFDLEDEIRIGNHVSVGHEVMFLTRGFDTADPARRAGAPTSAPVIVEDGAWLGARSVIMPGVRIGAGAVVGASVVVAEDVPEQTLVMGSQKISLARWR